MLTSRRRWILVGLAMLGPLALASLAWGVRNAVRDSGDLMRRAEEVSLFVAGRDPYGDPDMTYPPSAPVVFTPLVAPFSGETLRVVWIVLNLVALGVVCWVIPRLGARRWPWWWRLGFALAALASKPVRLSLGLGQFSLLPLALALAAIELERAEGDRRGKSWLAGLMLAIALVKPTVALPFLALFVVRGWTLAALAAIGFQAAALAGVAAWLQVSPSRLVAEWLARSRSQRAAGLIDVPSVAERFLPGASGYATPMALALLAACGAVLWVGRRRSLLAQTAIAGWFAALFTYHRPYDLVLLLPGLAWLIERGMESSGRFGLALGFAALLIVPSHPAVIREPLYDAVFITACYAVFGGMLHAFLREDAR